MHFCKSGKNAEIMISNQEHEFPGHIEAKTKCDPCINKNESSE